MKPVDILFRGIVDIADVCLNPNVNNKYKRGLIISNSNGVTIIFEDLSHVDFEHTIPSDVLVNYIKTIKL